MATSSCEQCGAFLKACEEHEDLAELLEKSFPNCACQHAQVGEGSPGGVTDDELLHRLIVSPRDFDPTDGSIRETQFRKVFKNGLSVWRAKGPDQDVEALLMEGLIHGVDAEPNQIVAVCEVKVSDVRQAADESGDPIFCVYDQTVSRRDPTQAPVGTHASIFQRLPLPKTSDRKRIQRDYAGRLGAMFIAGTIQASDYREGLCDRLNVKAVEGQFVERQ